MATSESPQVRLRALGPVDLRMPPGWDGEPLLRQPKRLGLLAYLALRGPDEFVPRDRLLSLFWPEAHGERARAALRQALRYLRQHLPPDVVRTRGRHDVGVQVASDAVDFDGFMRTGNPGEAIALDQGEFLDGFFFPEASNAFNDWLDAARNRYRSAAAEAAWALAVRSEREGRPAEAAFWAKRGFGLVPLSEPNVQRVMQLLHRVGDHAGALRAYQGLEDLLARELDLEPSSVSRALADRIRDSEPPPGVDAQFAGRRTEIERRSGRERRIGSLEPYEGKERRSGGDRRSGGERRSGGDRRLMHGSDA